MAQPLRLSTASPTFEADFKARLHWSADTDAAIEQRVAEILADVRARGDAAVLEYTERFDGLKAHSMAALELTQAELKTAFDGLPNAQRDALQAAAARVRARPGHGLGARHAAHLPKGDSRPQPHPHLNPDHFSFSDVVKYGIFEAYHRWSAAYGPVFKVMLGSIPVIVCCDGYEGKASPGRERACGLTVACAPPAARVGPPTHPTPHVTPAADQPAQPSASFPAGPFGAAFLSL